MIKILTNQQLLCLHEPCTMHLAPRRRIPHALGMTVTPSWPTSTFNKSDKCIKNLRRKNPSSLIIGREPWINLWWVSTFVTYIDFQYHTSLRAREATRHTELMNILLFSLILLLRLLLNISTFWYSFIELALHSHANRERKVLNDETSHGGLFWNQYEW